MVDQVLGTPDEAVVKFDRESFREKLDLLRQIPGKDDAIKLTCDAGVLKVENLVEDANASEGMIIIEVDSTANFENIVVNGVFFEQAIQRFNNFSIKNDKRRITFGNDTQFYGLSRRQG